jgi:hypothetical protein
MLEASRDAAAAGKEQLVSCAAEYSKYCFLCTATLDPCGDLPFTSWVRWQCLRGGADAGLNSYLLCRLRLRHRISVWGPAGGRRVATFLLEAMACFAPSQPNEGMARIASRSLMVPMVPMVNNKT